MFILLPAMHVYCGLFLSAARFALLPCLMIPSALIVILFTVQGLTVGEMS